VYCPIFLDTLYIKYYNIFPQKNEEEHNIEIDKYIKFVDTSLKTVQSSRIDIYSCKYSKHIYTQHQLFVLVLLKEYIITEYRDFIELIDLRNNINEKLDLNKIPHSTTFKNLNPEFLHLCLTSFCQKLKVILLTWRNDIY